MDSFVYLLGWLLLGLTFIGSYRLSAYLAPAHQSRLYPTLIASTLTIAFLIVVDWIILLTGIAVILLPAVVALQKLGADQYLPDAPDVSLPTVEAPDITLPQPQLPDRDTAEGRNPAVTDRLYTIRRYLDHVLPDQSTQDDAGQEEPSYFDDQPRQNHQRQTRLGHGDDD